MQLAANISQDLLHILCTGVRSLGICSHKSDVSYTKHLHMNYTVCECTSSGYPDFNCQLSVMDKRQPLEDYASHSTGYSPVWELWVYHCLSTSHIRTYLSNLTLGMGDRFAFQQTKASLKPCYLSFLWNKWKNPQSPTTIAVQQCYYTVQFTTLHPT